jgi:hypothetical protein
MVLDRFMDPPLPTDRRSFLRLLGALVAALTALRGGTPAFDDDRERWLREWAGLPRIPVREARGAVTAALLAHAAEGRPLALFYHGGARPGCLRRFSPELVFRHERRRHAYPDFRCSPRKSAVFAPLRRWNP